MSEMEEDSGEMTEILQLVDSIFQSLDVVVEAEDIAFIQSEEFYLQILEIIFSQHVQTFEEFKDYFENRTPGENIQMLIDFLSQSITGVDLNHINGEEIANGNRQHILNLLQLIHELASLKGGEHPDSEGEDGEDGEETEEGEEEGKDPIQRLGAQGQYYPNEEPNEEEGPGPGVGGYGGVEEIEEASDESSHNTNEKPGRSKGKISSTKKQSKFSDEGGLNERSNSAQENRRPDLMGDESDPNEEKEGENGDEEGLEGEEEGDEAEEEEGQEEIRGPVEFHQEPIENYIEPDSDQEIPGREKKKPSREVKKSQKKNKKSTTTVSGKSKKKEMEKKLVGNPQGQRFLTTKPEKYKKAGTAGGRPGSAKPEIGREQIRKPNKKVIEEGIHEEETGKKDTSRSVVEGEEPSHASQKSSTASRRSQEQNLSVNASRILEDPELLRQFLQAEIRTKRKRLAEHLHVPLQNDDAKTIDLLLKNKNKYKTYLRDYIKQHQIVENCSFI